MARYSKGAQKSVKSAMHRKKKGSLKSGKGGKGGTVKSRAQAIAIGLSEARDKGAKVPAKKKAAKKKAAPKRKAAPKKKTASKRKTATKKKAAPKKKRRV
jgi:hypothetical protein